ncbi:hypothetical protein [Nocardioides sp.]|uniref:hypothetical protein n=1 Tax=Nocardioides sp. TaxID=35761 RepID=UPI00261DF226|nr:hypothetical protein [Nocardioides sp.]
MTLSEHPSRESAVTNSEPDLRRALTGVQELLVMSMLMLDRHDVDEVIDVLAHAVEAVTRCQLVRVTFRRDQEWVSRPPANRRGRASGPVDARSSRTMGTSGRAQGPSRPCQDHRVSWS